MSEIKLKWESGLRFTATASAGKPVLIDGDRQEGTSPMELLLESLAGCTSIDVVAILAKMRQPLDRLEVSISGVRRDVDPKAYTTIELGFRLWGDGLDEAKVSRAVELSLHKYCSVYHSLNPEIKLTTKIAINSQA